MSDARPPLIASAVRGVGVVFFSQVGQYFVAFVVTAVLARFLAPSDFGVFATASVITGLMQVFTNLSNDRYMVKVKSDIHAHYSAVFTSEFCLSLIFFCLTLLLAAFVLPAYGMPEAVLPVQVLALTYFYTPFRVPLGLLDKEMLFVRSKAPGLVGQILGGGIAVYAAVYEFGLWSLVIWRLGAMLAELLIVWIYADVRPRLNLRIPRSILKEMLAFSLPLLGVNLLVYYYTNIDYYVVGKILGKESLGYYWLAFTVSHAFLKAKTAINSVLLPLFCKTNDDAAVLRYFEKITRITAFLYLIPIVIFFFFGREIILLVYGAKWLPVVPIFNVFFVLIAFRAVTGYADNIFLYKGRSDISFKLTVIYAVLLTPLVYFGAKYFDVVGAAVSVLIVNSVVVGVLVWYLYLLTRHTMGYLVRIFLAPLAVIVAVALIVSYSAASLICSAVGFVLAACMVLVVFSVDIRALRNRIAL